MGMKENFRMAVKELLPEEKPLDRETPASEENPFVSERQAPVFSRQTSERAASTPAKHTEIAAGVTVQGTIHGAGSVDIYGQWIGDVNIEEDLRLFGGLSGNLLARSVLLKGGRLRGDVSVGDWAEIDAESMVIGNIRAGELNLQGGVKGDLTVKGQLTLGATAVVAGQIKAGSVAVAAGAVLQGKIMIDSPDTGDLFHESEETPPAAADPAPAAAPAPAPAAAPAADPAPAVGPAPAADAPTDPLR